MAWIEPLSESDLLDLFADRVQEMDCIDSCNGDTAYVSGDTVVDYRTGEFYRASLHLQRPADTPMTYAYNGNGSICHDEHGEPLGRYCILEIREHYTPCSDDDKCDGDTCEESACLQEPSSWEWEYHDLLN